MLLYARSWTFTATGPDPTPSEESFFHRLGLESGLTPEIRR